MNQRRFFRPTLMALIAGVMVLVVAGCASSPDEERPSLDVSEPPQNYVEADVLGIVAAPGQGPAVLLGSQLQELILPIFINPSQAMAIQLGIEDRDFERPLTHDLVAGLMEELDGEIAKVQVDELREGTFYATIFLITPTEVVEVDARPSDAIAMAVGIDEEIPLYVAQQVLDDAGLSEDDVQQMPPADPGQPEDFDDSPTTPM